MQNGWVLSLDQRGAFVATKANPEKYIAWFPNPTTGVLQQVEELVGAHNRAIEGIRASVLLALECDLTGSLETQVTKVDS